MNEFVSRKFFKTPNGLIKSRKSKDRQQWLKEKGQRSTEHYIENR